MASKEKYKKYKYVIWSDEDGFFSLDALSEDDLRGMTIRLKDEISRRELGSGGDRSESAGKRLI